MSSVSVGYRVSKTGDWKGNCQSQNRELSDWIDYQALKSICSFVGSLLALKTCSTGRILARGLRSTPAEFEDVDFVINCKLFWRHIWLTFQVEYSGNEPLDSTNVPRLLGHSPTPRLFSAVCAWISFFEGAESRENEVVGTFPDKIIGIYFRLPRHNTPVERWERRRELKSQGVKVHWWKSSRQYRPVQYSALCTSWSGTGKTRKTVSWWITPWTSLSIHSHDAIATHLAKEIAHS